MVLVGWHGFNNDSRDSGRGSGGAVDCSNYLRLYDRARQTVNYQASKMLIHIVPAKVSLTSGREGE